MRSSGQEIPNEAGDPAALPGLDQCTIWCGPCVRRNLRASPSTRCWRSRRSTGCRRQLGSRSTGRSIPTAVQSRMRLLLCQTSPYLSRSRCRRRLRPTDHCQDQHWRHPGARVTPDGWTHEPVALGTNTILQRAEGRYRSMPGIIVPGWIGNPFSILTKAPRRG